MIKRDLTHYQKQRLLQRNQRCSSCGEYILDTEAFVLIKERVGRRIRYSFYHERCFNG